MERTMRRCCTCLQNYQFCPKCPEDKGKELFYFSFCSENCKNIYNVTSKFEDGQISIEEANKQLSNLDLSKLDNFGTSYKNSIAKIKTYTPTIIKNIADVVDMKKDEPELMNNEVKSISIKKPKTKKVDDGE